MPCQRQRLDGSVVASTAQIVSGPTNGIVANNGDGTFTYTPNVGPTLTDSFTYQVWDNAGDPSNVATVTITIRQPDLDIIKDALPDFAAPGEEVQFFIYVINNGPGIAFSASVSDNLGSCFHWVGSPGIGALGDLADGAALVLTPKAQVESVPAPGCDNTNQAEVSALNANTASDTVAVTILPTPPLMSLSMMMSSVGEPSATSAVPTSTEESPTPTQSPLRRPRRPPLSRRPRQSHPRQRLRSQRQRRS